MFKRRYEQFSREPSRLVVPSKPYDLLKHFLREKKEENAELQVTENDKLLCAKEFKDAAEIKKEGYDFFGCMSTMIRLQAFHDRMNDLHNDVVQL